MARKLRLFDRQESRKPNLYPWTQDFINAMWSGHWTPNEFDFKGDKHNFKRDMSEQERQMIVKTLTAIGQIEIAVKKFWAQLGDRLPHPSMSDLGYVLANTEVIHNQAYEKLLDTLGLQKAFEENLKVDVVKGRVEYLRKHLESSFEDDRKQYIYSIILFTLFVENVSLFSQFYTVMWFEKCRHILRDTAQQVLYTRNEETIHGMAGMKIINTLREEYPELFDDELKEKVLKECREALGHESKLIDWMVGDYNEFGEYEINGVTHKARLSAPVLKEYLKGRFNDSLVQIGFEKQFEIDDEIIADAEWMDIETLSNVATDFFHKRDVNYNKKHRTFNADDLFD